MRALGSWEIARTSGTASELHARRSWGGAPQRRVWLCECTGPAVVLGSVQPSSHIDADRALASGVEVVRRRSGGGAVLVVPGETVWVDVEVPHGDPLWESDVGKAFAWLGHVWADALDSLGLGPAVVHVGPLLHHQWSERVCFAGLGPGEVTVGGRKVLGLSQRRSHEGAVFSCATYLSLDHGQLAELLALEDGERRQVVAALGDRAAPLGAGSAVRPKRADVEQALLARLPGVLVR